ncbi:hypothetical protein RHGRI_038787 [Rhododendron griersonianum]|uniref:CoA carboxyltransferase N-terminal domain-containing protein n=1 Tax=Rhododendron griersonianum TaxID=479676 RepID=A0AAV6HME3_9ERIC|nr:hypothetical protein RHGRI_038787 [Rhododendron griersonianum]
MNSSDRIDLLIDPDTWVPMDEDMVSLAIEWDFEEKEEPFELDLSEWEAELKKVYIELELRIQLKKEKEKADQERLDSEEEEKISSEEKEKTDQDRLDSEKQDLLYSEEDDQTYLDRLDLEEEEKISSEEKEKTDQDRLDSEKQDLLYSEEDDQTYLDRLDLEEEEKISSEEKEKTDQDLLDSEKDEQTYQDRLDLEEEEKIYSEEKEKTDQDRLDSEEDDQTYQERLNSNQSETGLPEAIQTGIGELNGLPLALGVLDFQFIAGTMGSAVGEKITRLIEYATREFLPLIIVCASGGARIHEGSFSLMQMGKIACALYNYQLDAKRFYISILASPTTGGVTASFGMLGKVVIAEPEATIAFADVRGRVVSWSSAGTCRFRAKRRGTPFAAQTTVVNAIRPVVDQEDQEEEEIDFEEIDFEEIEIEKEMAIEKEEEKVRWINLHKFLFEAGIVFLSEKLNRKKGKIILGLITYLAILHPIGELHLFLNNCVSGCLRTAVTMHDAIQQLPRPGYTVGCGMTASVGSLILVSGHERLAQPHARILIQKPKFKFPIKRKKKNSEKNSEKNPEKNPNPINPINPNNPKKNPNNPNNPIKRFNISIGKRSKRKRKNLRRYFDVHEAKKQFDILTEYFHEIFVEKTGQSYDIIQKDLQENVVMSAKEAQDYGIIDRLTTDFKMKSLLHKAFFPNLDDNFEENRNDTPGWR